MNRRWIKDRWHNGNRVRLLQDGDEFFPRVLEAIAAAREEVFVETFILSDDKVGRALRSALIEAGQRGVRVAITVDGFGSPGLEGEFIDGLTAAGVEFHIFSPGLTLFGIRTNLFRRLHRKIVVADGRIAFVGGINFIADQLSDFGPEAKRDYAVEIEGPVVHEIRDFVEHALRRPHFSDLRRRRHIPPKSVEKFEDDAKILFVTRDNRVARTHIERQYHLAIRQAQSEILIANAYFLPGYRLLWRLRQAARRGVKVSLILQGRPDIGMVKWATCQLYDYLLGAGIHIYEYGERPLHGKVALADDDWATIGSSNLDPLSLSLNLEANVVIRDRQFNQTLRERLYDLMENHCVQVPHDPETRSRWWNGAIGAVVFHVLRNFPNWVGWLPKHIIVLKKVEVTAAAGEQPDTAADAASDQAPSAQVENAGR